jgi:hypothetical protein
MEKLEVGTLIKDDDKIGIIARVIRMGRMDFDNDLITWRDNYEIHYLDGHVTVIGVRAFNRLVDTKRITIIESTTTTPLPPSYPTSGGLP